MLHSPYRGIFFKKYKFVLYIQDLFKKRARVL